MKIETRPTVIIRRCETYDAEAIRTIVREGMEELGLRPRGRTLVKPNLVAAGPLFPHAHTHPVFAEGVLRALKDRAVTEGEHTLTELAIGERCGITIPSRVAFSESGFDAMLARVGGVRRYLFDEVPQVEIRYTHKDRLRDYVYTPEPIAKADFFVNIPKFKAHPWTTVTFSMKNYIGIQDDRHRLIDHDHRLNEKIADLQYIIQPQLIAIDAITAGEGRMLTPKPFPMGLVILGNNQVAFDAVCCQTIGLDPRSVDHIRLAEDRGFGTTDLSRIRILGDVTLAGARQRAQGFKVGLTRIEKYFEGSRITAYAGAPPESERTDYCWGGCPGALQEAIEVLRLYDEQCDEKLPRMHVVFGAYEGDIPAGPGDKVVFIGDCATWKGELRGELVQIRSTYKPRETHDPHRAQHADIFGKMATVSGKVLLSEGKSHVRLHGCPVSVAEQALALVGLSDVNNPYLDVEHALPFQKGYLAWRAQQALSRLRGEGYQKPGACPRGHAAPELPDAPIVTTGDTNGVTTGATPGHRP
ncbi:MAG: DUF362 domain-containing protein [Polyangia bacterium]